MWVTAAGWADAARRRLGASWVVTPDAIAEPADAARYARPASQQPTVERRRLPAFAGVAAKDARQFLRQRRYARSIGHGPWEDDEVRFVWQHHDLFHRAGGVLAGRLDAPLVSYVHAPQVWEATKWGVSRLGYARLLERVAEAPQLVESDLIACASEEVLDAVLEMGADPGKVVVAPMAVDTDRFRPGLDATPARSRYGVEDAFVVGWIGSFRRFHGLELLLDAFADLARRDPAARLLLLGDGAERAAMEAHVAGQGISDRVVFAGSVGHEEVPSVVAAMDVAVVTGRPDGGFHYSPLKLREYLASGLPTVAPRLGEVGREFEDGVEVLGYDAGSSKALTDALERLRADHDLRASLSAAARRAALERYTWLAQVDLVLSRLDAGPGSSP